MTNPTRPTPAPGDPSAFLARLAAMERRIAELEANQPGYGNLSAGSKGNRLRVPYYMRDLFDADLWDIADGEAVVWDASVGKFRPGSAGGTLGVGRVWSSVTIPSETFTTVASLTMFGSEAVGVSISGGNTIILGSAGSWSYCVMAKWEANATGHRLVSMGGTGLGFLEGPFPEPADSRPAVGYAGLGTFQATPWAYGNFGASSPQNALSITAWQSSPGDLDVEIMAYLYRVK